MVANQSAAGAPTPPKICTRSDGLWPEVYCRSEAGRESAHWAGGGQFPKGTFLTFPSPAKFPLGKLGTKVHQKMRSDILYLLAPLPQGVTLLRLKVIHEEP
jgi:hypothetical protein